MKYILKKADISCDGGFVGNGKLTPAKESKDSWVIKQIVDKKIIPAIKRKRDKDGLLRFSSKNCGVKFSSLKEITENILHSFSSVEKNYSFVKDGKYFCVRMAWTVKVFSDDDFLELKDISYYSELVTKSAKKDISSLMITPVRLEGTYDLKDKCFSVCATAVIPIEFVNYFRDELEKRGF